MPSAKAAPKFLLAEGEGKWLSLPTVTPELFLRTAEKRLQAGNYPKPQQGRITALGGIWISLSQLSLVPSEHPHHPADSDSETSLLYSPAGLVFFLPHIRNWITTTEFKGLN